MSLYDDMLAAHGTPAAALEAMRAALGHPGGLMRHVESASAQVRSWPSYPKREATMPTSDLVAHIRDVLIESTDIIEPGSEPYVGWSQVLAERIAAALHPVIDKSEDA